jgi:hypothetical protein
VKEFLKNWRMTGPKTCFQAAQSRAIRNVVLAGVPRWLTDQAKERAKEVATDKALKFLAGYGITEARVVGALGKSKQEWAIEDIATLRGMASQLKDGQATAEHLFPVLETKTDKSKAAPKRKRGRPAKTAGPKSPSLVANLLPPQPRSSWRLSGWLAWRKTSTRP